MEKDELKGGKIDRILGIYSKLMDGYIVNKQEEADRYGVNDRSIQRDIDDIRDYLENRTEDDGVLNSVIYDRERKGYRLEQIYKIRLTNAEVFAVCKILLDSRAFTKKEMSDMLARLVDSCVPESNRKLVKELIRNEEYHYIEPHHKTKFLDRMWEIGQAIRNRQYIQVDYQRLKDKKIVSRKLEPLAVMFSEYYFYVLAFIDDPKVRKDFDVMDDAYPTIYRIDRFKKVEVLDEKYHKPYSERFEEGEFRKRVQFMYGGKLRRLKFKYTGLDVNAILDRLPTAEIIDEDEEGYTIKAEVFGDGVDMWLGGQGDSITIVE